MAFGVSWVGTENASAGQVVTFLNQSVDHLSSAGPMTEAGFRYQAVSGEGWEIQSRYGNGGSSLATFFNNEWSANGDTVVIRRDNGGYFAFKSVDTSTMVSGWSDQVTITGYLGSTVVGSLLLNTSTAGPTSFVTVASSFSGTIDTLKVVVTWGGWSGARYLDNFHLRVIAAPEPSASVMISTILATGLFAAGRQRFRRI